MTVAIRRARTDDLDFVVALVTHEEVEPFLAAARATDPSSIRKNPASGSMRR